MHTHDGTVTKITANKIEIQFQQDAMCLHCQIKNICMVSHSRPRILHTKIQNPQDYHVGDKVTIRFEYTLKIPETCANCPFYTEREYMNHTVIGFESHCSLGFMNEFDTRFISYKNKKFEQCRLEHFIVEGNEDVTTK